MEGKEERVEHDSDDHEENVKAVVDEIEISEPAEQRLNAAGYQQNDLAGQWRRRESFHELGPHIAAEQRRLLQEEKKHHQA